MPVRAPIPRPHRGFVLVRRLVFVLLGCLGLSGLVVGIVVASGAVGSTFTARNVGKEVRVESASRRALVERVSAPGEVEPNVKVDVSAEISARIVELPFREGDAVRKGDVIIRLDAEDFEARLESSKARRDAERFRLQSEESGLSGPLSALENAKSKLERQETLFQSGDVSRQAIDDARNQVNQLEAQVSSAQLAISVIESSLAAAEADIDQAREALEKTVMQSPIDGVVTVLNAEVGELVVVGTRNNAGTVIMTIADLSRMRLDARIAESDVARVAESQPAEIRINAYPDKVFMGVVERLALQRSVDRDGSGYFKAEIQIDLDGRRILSGLAANVDVEIATHQGIVVPSQAVQDLRVDELPRLVAADPLVDRSRLTVPVVYVASEGQARCRPVRLGPSSLTETVVADGISVDDAVIIGPYKILSDIRDGARISTDTSVVKTKQSTEVSAVTVDASGG